MRRGTVDDTIDPEALSVFAAARRDAEHVRFEYRSPGGESSGRLVQPHQLVTAGRRWYLVAWDVDRDDWRTFRVDRLRNPRLVGSHFAPREVPGGAGSFVADAIGGASGDVLAKLAIGARFADLDGVLRWFDHTLIEADGDHCLVQLRSEDLGRLAMAVARIALAAPVTVIEPPELADSVRQLAAHLRA